MSTDFVPAQPDPNEIHRERMYTASQGLVLATFLCLLVSVATWTCVWYRNRTRPAFRYATITFIFIVFILRNAAERISTEYIYFQTLEQIGVLSLTAYAILCMVRSINQAVSMSQTMLCLALVVFLSIVLNGVEFLVVTTNLDWEVDSLALSLAVVDIPKMLSIVAGLVVTIVLIYWLFCLDNRKYRAYREYRVIRQSSVCLLVLFAYFLAVEITDWVWRYAPYDDVDIHPLTRPVYMVTSTSRGLVVCIFLCFLDLEILALFPCVDLGQDLDDADEETNPLTEDAIGRESPKVPSAGADGKVHVSSFETEITPRPLAQAKQPAYGTIVDAE